MSACCDVCGIPLDAEWFDESGFVTTPDLPPPGERAMLAGFQLHSQYCGVLSWFAQFTDAYAIDNSQVATPGLEWIIMRNGQPLFPYHNLESIVNPWGYGGTTFSVRLDENARVELFIHNRAFDYEASEVTQVGGRIMGQYWYNAAFGERL